MKILVLLSLVAATFAAPQFGFGIQKNFAAPLFNVPKPFGAPQYTVQKVFASPQFVSQKKFSYQNAQHAAPTIVNFGLERIHPDQGELILRQTQTHDVDGTYSTDVELEKGIKINEQGYLKNIGTDAEAQFVQGQFSYVGDDGQTYTVSYVADENGFQPQGAHLPTPPPIPQELEKAFALARADPNYKETDEQ